jgi:hypothetical protein
MRSFAFYLSLALIFTIPWEHVTRFILIANLASSGDNVINSQAYWRGRRGIRSAPGAFIVNAVHNRPEFPSGMSRSRAP